MPTIVSNTIGTGGTYTTVAAWFAACPADLVAADQIWQGRVLNQELTTAGTMVTMSGKTTSSACYVELTADTGASFLDHADKATNPLRYDATKGAALRVTGDAAFGVFVSGMHVRISKLQFHNSSSVNPYCCISGPGASGHLIIDRVIAESYVSHASTRGVIKVSGLTSTISNSIIVQKATSTSAAIALVTAGAVANNCTFASLGATLTSGVSTQYDAVTFKNCYIGGATAPVDAGGVSNKVTCYASSAATGFTVAALSTATFANVTIGTHDFRLVSGSTLIDAGTTETTYAATDILGTARPQGGAYDVGAHELAVVDVTAPTLSLPTATSTGATSGSGSVTTTEAGGTLYYLVSVNATETAAAVKAGASKAVTASGVQSVTVTGLTALTAYRIHYLHTDAASLDSTVATSGSFTTASGADTTAPILEAAAATTTGSTTASGSVATNEAGGTLYRFVSTSSTATAAAVKAANLTSTVEATGTQAVLFTGLTASTTYYAHYLQRDAAGNDSAVATSSAFSTLAAVGGTFKTRKFANNTDSGWPQGTALVWQWHQAGRIGSASTSITFGTGSVASDGTLTITGCPNGDGYLLAAVRGPTIATDKPFYQFGTVA